MMIMMFRQFGEGQSVESNRKKCTCLFTTSMCKRCYRPVMGVRSP